MHKEEKEMTFPRFMKALNKNNQTRYLSKTWHDMQAAREVQKNNYRATHDLKTSRAFMSAVLKYQPTKVEVKHSEPTVIFSREMLELNQNNFVFA